MKTLTLVTLMFLSCLAYAQSKTQGLTKINGTKLYINVKGKGDHLLVLHGGPGLNHSYFLPHLAAIEKNFRVIYFDQRACGKSAIPSADSISIKFLVADIEAIRQKFKIDKLNILAHSWGALLAAHYALTYPDNVKKMVLSNPSMFSREYDEQAAELVTKNSTREDSTARTKIMSGGVMDSKKYEELFLLSFKPSAFNKDNVAKLNLNLPENFSTANNTLFTALMKDPAVGKNLYESISVFEFPVLIIHGAADVVPYPSIERLNAEITGSQLVVLKESGHFPFVEEMQLYNSTVIDFLKVK